MSTVKSGTPAAAKPGTPAILGIPFDANSSYLRGSAGAPWEIRSAMHSSSSNYWTELGVDLGVEGIFYDAGNLKFSLRDAFGCIGMRWGSYSIWGIDRSCWAAITRSRCQL